MYRALKGILIIGLLSCSFTGFGQIWRHFPGILQRYEIGYSFIANTASYETHDRLFSPLLSLDVDTSSKTDVKTAGGFGVTMGTAVPLKRLGQKSMLTLSIGYMYNAMLWDYTSRRYVGISEANYTFSGGTVQMSLPIGLDLKLGCDAISNKGIRFTTTFGIGALPSYSATVLDNNGPSVDALFGVAPYVKAEAGIFAGICWKVRALYSIGAIPYMDYSHASNDFGTESATSTKLTGKSSLTVSLIVMPFGFTWKKSEWYNTY